MPEKTIGASFQDEPLSHFGFWADWTVRPHWNLCNAPGTEGGKVASVKAFLDSSDTALVCTPLGVIDEAVEKIREGTIPRYAYDARPASLTLRP